MNCPKCTHVLRPNARFCDHCGAPVGAHDPAGGAGESDSVETLREYDPLVGRVLDGKYELLTRVGEGGMGVVYRGRRVHIGDEVAVKVLLQKYVADAASVERFRREARAAAMLRHVNVVAIYDYGEGKGDDAPAYIVMELVEGVSLRQLLEGEGRLATARAVALMHDICLGVGSAHRRGVFHRDLKPDNVIILPPDEDRDRESAKVVDFGIAKLRDQGGAPTLTQTGAVVGTPYYMSPEQCRGEPLDARSDVYSLGAMIYEMLAGSPPFTAETITGVIAKHLFDEPPPLPQDLGVPAAIEEVIRRALAKDPNERQPGASAFARELQEAERRARLEQEEEERRREEEERRREEEERRAAEERARAEAEARRRAEEEAARQRTEQERRAREEEERRAREEEARRVRQEEEARREQEERERRASEEAEKQRRLEAIAAAAAAAKAAEEQRERRRVAQAVAEARAAEEQREREAAARAAEERRREAETENARRRQAEERERQRLEAEEAARRKAEAEEEARREAETQRHVFTARGARLASEAAASALHASEADGAPVRLQAASPAQPPPTPAQPSAPPAPPRRRFMPHAVAAVLVVALGGVALTSVWFSSMNVNKGAVDPSPLAEPVGGGSAPAAPTPAPETAPVPPDGMVYVPGGEFLMGRNDSEDEFERPAHAVKLAPFFIDRFEVTREDYLKFRPGDSPATSLRQPVTGVDWKQADEFCRWAGKRLPTEQEWEYAARGADGRLYPWGNEWGDGLANAKGARGGLADVGEFGGASPFGAYDMVGNAWEWTASPVKPYPGGRSLPPQPGADRRIIRGGSFDASKQATTTWRGYLRMTGGNYDKTGFRCAKDAAVPAR